MISLHAENGRYERSLWMGVGPGVGYGLSDDVSGNIRIQRQPGLAGALSTIDICISVIEGYFQAAPMSIQRRLKDGKLEKLSSHALSMLVEVSPNGVDTAPEWIGILAQEFERTGNAMAIIHRNAERVMMLEPFRLGDAEVTKSGAVYTWRIGGEVIVHDTLSGMPAPIFHVAQNRRARRQDGDASCQHLFGSSPVRNARLEMEASAYGQQYFRDMMYLGGRGQVGIVDGDPQVPEQEELNSKSKQMTEVLSNPQNRGTVPIFPKDTEIVQLAHDLKFLETMRYADEKLAGLYKIPMLFINNLERSTYSNARTVVEHFVTQTMANKYRLFEAAFKRQVIGYRGPLKNIYMKFVTDDLLKDDPVKQSMRVKTFAGLGALKVDEIRDAYGSNVDPIGGKDGEARFIGSKQVGSDAEAEPIPPPPVPDESPQEEGE